MSKNNNENISYLQVLSDYLLLTETQQYDPKIINELYENLNEILRKIQSKLVEKVFEEQDCQEITQQIDKLIYLSAELTQRSIEDKKNHLAEFKEKLWLLLETLEQYCTETFNLSIW